MYKATSESAHYLRREGNHSTKPSPRGVNLLGWTCDEALPPEEQRRAMCARLTQINHYLRDNKKLPKLERAQLVGEVIALTEKVRAIRPKRVGPTGMQQHFIDVARERLTKAEFHIWMTEATERARKQVGNDDQA